MKNIYIVGFMGSGKTTVGKILADRLNKQFIEMDQVIEQRTNKKIADIFAEYGQDYFRKLETSLLQELSTQNDLVISCGGGLICNNTNLKILKTSGIVFNITASAQIIYERTKKDSHRPILNVKNPLNTIKTLLGVRKPYYEQAHYTVESEKQTPEQVANSIMEILKKISDE